MKQLLSNSNFSKESSFIKSNRTTTDTISKSKQTKASSKDFTLNTSVKDLGKYKEVGDYKNSRLKMEIQNLS